MFNRRSLIAVALAGSALAGGYALAQPDQATVGIQTTTRYSLEGRIAAVDTNARTITITVCRRHPAPAEREPDGRQHHQHKGRRQRGGGH